MINISGYLKDNNEDFMDEQNDLTVISCGHYKLKKMEKMETWRPFGRIDYQLLYIAQGPAYFELDDGLTEIPSNSFFLYRPLEKQHYMYYQKDNPDVYWLHFTGAQAETILDQYFPDKNQFFQSDAREEYVYLFNRIIRELQLKRRNFQSLTRLYAEELLSLISRSLQEDQSRSGQSRIVEQAILHFHQNYAAPISIQEYAEAANISCCWFIRMFRQHTGMTPGQYLANIRISKAMELLKDGSLNINETAAFVGYENALYFSRIFKKHTGVSPREFQKSELTNTIL